MKTLPQDAHEGITEELLKTNYIIRNVTSPNSVFYECLVCKAKRLTDETLLTHVVNLKHTELVRRRKDGDEKYTDTKYHSQCVQHSLLQLIKETCNDDEHERRIMIVQELESILQCMSANISELEDVTLEMYGSSAFYCALKHSDINCFIHVKEYLLCVKHVVEIIKQYSDTYDEPVVTTGHRFPRIKFKHKESALSIVLSIHSVKSANFTDLMNCFFSCDKRALQLGQLLKIHAFHLNLMDGTFERHLFPLLAVYFCQNSKPPLLPKFEMGYDKLMSRAEEDKVNRDEKLEREKASSKATNIQTVTQTDPQTDAQQHTDTQTDTQAETKGEAQIDSPSKFESSVLSSDEVAMGNFSANVVMGILRQSLFRVLEGDQKEVSVEEVETLLKRAKVDDLYPQVGPENDPWNQGSNTISLTSAWDEPSPFCPSEDQTVSSSSPKAAQHALIDDATDQSMPNYSVTENTKTPDESSGGDASITVDKSVNNASATDASATDESTNDGCFEAASNEERVKLSQWGDLYLAGAKQQCYSWKSENSKELHALFQEMVRFFAKFSFDCKTISICRPATDCANKYAFVEDPFQPNAVLYNLPNHSKSKKNKKMGKSRMYSEMAKHIKSVFELMRHYYETPHKRELCLSSPSYSPSALPPFSPFELAVRYDIPEPFTQLHQPKQQEALPPIDSVGESAVRALESMIQKIQTKYTLTTQDEITRELVFKELKELVVRYLDPQITPLWFGSSRNGLVLNTSDMDITLDVSKVEPVDPASVLGELAKAIKDNKMFILEDVILQARVPIIKFRRIDNDLTGDIAVGNMLAIANTRLIRTYTQIDRRVADLGILVKSVMKECQCADASTGSLSSYAYTMMVIFFLQQIEPPVIPVLQEINRPLHTSEEYIVDNWDTYFYSEIHKQTSDWPCDNSIPVGLLALRFFKYYYEEFDYETQVIAPRQKAPLLCTEKRWFKSINIEDPFNLDHNLGKQVSPKTMDVIKTVMRQAYLRYSVGPLQRNDLNIWYYLDKAFLLDGHNPPINFACYNCGSRDHYISECPSKNRCSNCNEGDHPRSACPRIVCFNCSEPGHLASSCPKRRQNRKQLGLTPEKKQRGGRKVPEKAQIDCFDRNNWIGQALGPPDIPIGKRTQHGNSCSDVYFSENSGRRSELHASDVGRREQGVSPNGSSWATGGSGPRKDTRPQFGAAWSRDLGSRKRGERSVSECAEKSRGKEGRTRSSSECEGASAHGPPITWSDPIADASQSQPKNIKVVTLKTTSDSKAHEPKAKEKNAEVPKPQKIQPAPRMKFMGGAVTTPVPAQARDDSRQKKSKSMVRQDIFGDQKPKAASVGSSNKRKTVKTAKIKAPPPEPGSGRKATKTEIWRDRGVLTEGSRYGPKRQVDDCSGDYEPDFFHNPQYLHNPDPNNLSEWGDLTPSLEADSVMGAALQQDIGHNAAHHGTGNQWIDYLSSSPEKPVVKPTSSLYEYNHDGPSQQYHSPPKNRASQELLEQLQGGSPRNRAVDPYLSQQQSGVYHRDMPRGGPRPETSRRYQHGYQPPPPPPAAGSHHNNSLSATTRGHVPNSFVGVSQSDYMNSLPQSHNGASHDMEYLLRKPNKGRGSRKNWTQNRS